MDTDRLAPNFTEALAPVRLAHGRRQGENMTDSDRTRTPKDDPRPTPEADRGDILREHRAQSIEVDYDMLLARGQDAERTPGRKPRMWALLTEIDDGNPPKIREVASFGFWATAVVVLALAVARC